MEKVVKVAMLDDEVQEELLASLLDDAGIPHVMKSYHDTALDGIFQGAKYWGHVEAPEEFKDQILEIIADIKAKNTDASLPDGESI